MTKGCSNINSFSHCRQMQVNGKMYTFAIAESTNIARTWSCPTPPGLIVHVYLPHDGHMTLNTWHMAVTWSSHDTRHLISTGRMSNTPRHYQSNLFHHQKLRHRWSQWVRVCSAGFRLILGACLLFDLFVCLFTLLVLFMRENIVGFTLIFSVIVWVPLSLTLYFCVSG